MCCIIYASVSNESIVLTHVKNRVDHDHGDIQSFQGTKQDCRKNMWEPVCAQNEEQIKGYM